MTTAQHVPLEELAARLPEMRTAPADHGVLVQIVIRPDRDLRTLADTCELRPECGIPGDRWLRHCARRLADGTVNPDTQLTLMNTRVLAAVAGPRDRWALAGDNLLVDLDLGEDNLPAGARLAIGGAVVEITAEPHTACSKFRQRYGEDALRFVNTTEGRRLRLRGANARVVQAGRIRVGDRVRKLELATP